jgi:predicted nucleic acid-binding protein
MDSSALAKLAKEEPESAALIANLDAEAHDSIATSVIGRVEVERAARRFGVPDADVEALFGEVDLLPFHIATAAIAGRLEPVSMRSLDAVHLATACGLGSDLAAMYCYDRQLADAARAIGIDVRSPGAES